MATELAKQAKTRTRNAPEEAVLDQSSAAAEPTIASKRTSSIMATQDMTIIPSASSSAAPSITSTVRHYRSMLDVEDPPKLNPLNPMSFDELYTPQDQEQPPKYESEEPPSDSTSGTSGTSGSSRTSGSSGELPGNGADDQVKDLGC